MQKFKIVLLALAITILPACSLFKSAPDPQEVIQDMLTKMQALESVGFNLQGDLQYDSPETNDKGGAQFKFLGSSISVDPQNPQLDLTLDLNISSNEEIQGDLNGNLKVQLKISNQNFYFQLVDLKLPAELQNQVAPILAMYQAKWFKLPVELIPDNIKSQLLVNTPEQIAKQDEIQGLISKTKFFDVTANTEEENNFVYTTNLNSANILAFIKEMGVILEEDVSADDLTAIENFLNLLDESIVLKIDQDSHFLNSLSADLKLEEEGNHLTINLQLAMNQFNDVAAIEAPTDAEEFNPMSLMGLGMMTEENGSIDMTTPPSEDLLGTGAEITDLNDVTDLEALDLPTDTLDMEALQKLENIQDAITE